MAIPPIPPGAPGAQFVKDSNANPIGLFGKNGDILARNAFDAPIAGATLAAMDGSDGVLALFSSGAGEAAAYDTSTGLPMVKCTLSTTAGALFQARYTLTTPLYIGGFSSIQIPLYFTDMSGTEINSALVQVLFFGETSGQSVRSQLTLVSQEPGKICVESFSRESTWGGSAPPSTLDGERVSKIEIWITAGSSSVAKAPIFIGPIKVNNRRKKGRILIYADGEYLEQNKYLLPLLDKFDLKMNLAITNAQLVAGGGAVSLRMNENMLGAAYANGHDIVHHTFGSASAGWGDPTSYPSVGGDNGFAAIVTDITSQWAYLTSMGWKRGIGHTVSGYTEAFTGTVSNARQLAIVAALDAAGVKTCRVGSNYQPATQGGVGMLFPIAHPNANWKRFYGGIQITSTHTALDVIKVIDQAAQRGEMGTILLHHPDVDTAAPENLGMTMSNNLIWVEYLAAMVASGQIICDTVDVTYHALTGN